MTYDKVGDDELKIFTQNLKGNSNYELCAWKEGGL
jgi:hypothetical protein